VTNPTYGSAKSNGVSSYGSSSRSSGGFSDCARSSGSESYFSSRSSKSYGPSDSRSSGDSGYYSRSYGSYSESHSSSSQSSGPHSGAARQYPKPSSSSPSDSGKTLSRYGGGLSSPSYDYGSSTSYSGGSPSRCYSTSAETKESTTASESKSASSGSAKSSSDGVTNAATKSSTASRSSTTNKSSSAQGRGNGKEFSSGADASMYARQALDQGEAVVYVDGASKRNPGHSGSGVYIELNRGKETVSREVALTCGKATNNYAELQAVRKGIEYAQETARAHGADVSKVNIMTDSNWCRNILNGTWKPSAEHLKPHIEEVKALIDNFRKSGGEVEIHWVKGHSDITGNNRADQLANEGARMAEVSGIDSQLTEPRVVRDTGVGK